MNVELKRERLLNTRVKPQSDVCKLEAWMTSQEDAAEVVVVLSVASK